MPNRPIAFIKFQENTIAPSDGEILSVNTGSSILNIDIKNTSTDAVLNFEARINENLDWVKINAVNLTNYDISTTANTDGIYQIDLTGLSFVRCRVSDITDGDITVNGKVVS